MKPIRLRKVKGRRHLTRWRPSQLAAHCPPRPETLCLYLRRCDGPVALQPGRVPDLGFHQGVSHQDGACGELHPNRGTAVVVELVAGEAREQIGLSHPRFSNQNHWEEEEDNAV